ncbi:lipoate--protein ligase [Oceanirhabdus sp. W0125-5]|uniref:lipoate--protein ligase n=1 Tax=Oceanirhabdus sp. W0125-5 TaxID=2999116 RepID=UPI0022F2FB0F|nr:lipoate--protein ligase [Oceanirhabdus sp. W0125-5]WBW96416.1 lipoate--protein ligase [Oceanirhabdus sp. W0125-5]
MDKLKCNIYISQSYNTGFNLSLEEYFLDNVKEHECVFFLWQSKNSIVIGRNQNALKECNIERINQDNVQLIRRLSGGGAVYHDLGNINFSFITHENFYSLEKQFKVILNALKKFGINGEFNGRNDLIVDDRKFSGNAFISEKDNRLHHGTLLVNTNLEKLKDYLNPSQLKIKAKGFDSVKSRVINLKDINNSLTIELLKDNLITSFEEVYGQAKNIYMVDEVTIKDNLEPYIKKYLSKEWNYDDTPEFDINFEEKYSWGIIDFKIVIDNGFIRSCHINTDSIILDNFNGLSKNLTQAKVNKDIIFKIVYDSINNSQLRRDIFNLLKRELNL